MQNFLGRCLAAALVAGGFTATGDLAWLMRHGAGVLSARDVPAPAADDDAPIPIVNGATCPLEAGAVSRQPPRGPEHVDVASLRRGDRLRIWLAAAVTAGAAPLVLDVVDPASGAAIIHRGGGERVRLSGAIRRGGMLEFVPLGLAHAGTSPAREEIGPITALDVDR